MRTFFFAIACILLVPETPAQERPIPPLKLPEPREPAVASAARAARGGVVYARIDATGTQIEAMRDIGDRAQAIEAISFPVFAPRGVSAADVLERSKFYAHLGAVQLEDIAVARAPANSPKPPPGAQIVWFQFLLKDLDPEKIGDGERILFKVSFWQPHVGGHFFYLPQQNPADNAGAAARAWNQPLIVRSLMRLVDPPKGDVDFERMADLLIVFPKDATLVAIPVAPTTGPSARPGSAPPPAKGPARRP